MGRKKLMTSIECKRRLDILVKGPKLNEKDFLYIEKIEYQPLLSEEDMFFNKLDMDYLNGFFKRNDRKYIEKEEKNFSKKCGLKF